MIPFYNLLCSKQNKKNRKFMETYKVKLTTVNWYEWKFENNMVHMQKHYLKFDGYIIYTKYTECGLSKPLLA